MKLLDDFERSGLAVVRKVVSDIDPQDVKKIIKHAKEHSWFEISAFELDGEESYSYLQRYISDHILNYGSPTLLRTGLSVENQSNDLLLIAWKSRVTRIAEQIIADDKTEYSGLDITWLLDLLPLSTHEDGPARTRNLLRTRGVVLVVEPQIAGLKLDGAAFLINKTPVIGMTLRRDTIDNFWFTLLHEIGHVILHYKMGLRMGFFDEIDGASVDEIEEEANNFASNIIISNEKWKRSPARIAKSAAVIEKLAKDAGIHPAIIFGRVQRERRDYATFANKIGRGLVRKWLLDRH